MSLRTPPSVPATLSVGAALVLSTVPSLLPRSAPLQGFWTGALVLLSLALLALARRVPWVWRGAPWAWLGVPWVARREEVDRSSKRARWLVLAGAVAVVCGAAWLAQLNLAATSAELSMSAPGGGYWLASAGWALAVLGLGLTTTAGARRTLPSLTRAAGRPLIGLALLGAALTSAAAAPQGLLDGLRNDLSPDHVMLVDSPMGASRSFALASETDNPEAGAALAVDRLVADGGLRRGAILVVLPTGSGWVNREAVTALETEFSGDVAVVSAQYDDLPSWWSYLADQEPSRRSARALLGGVVERVGALREAERPDIYVYGESLGALAGQAAVADTPAATLCGAIWAGAPGGAVSGHPRERVLRNADDPITYLSVETALEEPGGWPTLWLPGLSYATTVLDMGASLEPHHGHGHMYGSEQDWSLPQC